MSPREQAIQVRLRGGEQSLADLLAGELALRIWLTPNDDGTYALHALQPGDESTEALLRVMAAGNGDQPPTPEPSAEVADLVERWAALMESLPAPPENA